MHKKTHTFLKLRSKTVFTGSNPGAVLRIGSNALRVRGRMEHRRAAPPQAARCASARVLRKRFVRLPTRIAFFLLGNEIADGAPAGAPGRGVTTHVRRKIHAITLTNAQQTQKKSIKDA